MNLKLQLRRLTSDEPLYPNICGEICQLQHNNSLPNVTDWLLNRIKGTLLLAFDQSCSKSLIFSWGRDTFTSRCIFACVSYDVKDVFRWL